MEENSLQSESKTEVERGKRAILIRLDAKIREKKNLFTQGVLAYIFQMKQ